MKTFIYTYKEGKTPRDNSGIKKTARVYELVDNQLSLVGEATNTFVGDMQLVLDILETAKALPESAFKRGPHGGHVYYHPYQFRDAGIAHIHHAT